jgi:hypothetical protein
MSVGPGRKRRKEYTTIFVHGKQKRVRRPVRIEGLDVDEFLLRNGDPVWFVQNEMVDDLHAREEGRADAEARRPGPVHPKGRRDP